jgi:hypothetical protein
MSASFHFADDSVVGRIECMEQGNSPPQDTEVTQSIESLTLCASPLVLCGVCGGELSTYFKLNFQLNRYGRLISLDIISTPPLNIICSNCVTKRIQLDQAKVTGRHL